MANMASQSRVGRLVKIAAFGLAFGFAACAGGWADDAPTPPTPTASPSPGAADILALLDQEKPDPAALARRDAAANAAIAGNLPQDKRAEGFFHRAHARDDGGRINDAIADVQQAIELSKGENYTRVTSRYQQYLHRLLLRSGDDKGAIKLMISEVDGLERRDRGRLFTLYDELAHAYARAGDYPPIERLSRSGHALLAETQSWSAKSDPFRPGYRLAVDDLDATLQQIRNQYGEAERLFEDAAQAASGALARYDPALASQGENYPTREDHEQAVDGFQVSAGAMKVQLGRAQDGEVDIREGLLGILKRNGKNNERTGAAVSTLGFAMLGEGRYEDAERLIRATLAIYRTVGLRDETPRVVGNLQQLAQSLEGEKKADEAQTIYDQIDRLVAGWDPVPREAVMNETPRLKRLIETGKADEAVELATRKLARERARSGDDSQATAVVRGYLASALAKSGHGAEALVDFKAAIPILTATSRQEDSDDDLTAGAIDERNRFILENYLALLASEPNLADAGAIEATLGLADDLRGRSVQRALAEASARAAVKDPALGGLARSEQDLSRQLNDAIRALADVLALPPDKRDAKTVGDAQTKVARLRVSHAAAKLALSAKFPTYAKFIDPPPIEATEIRALLGGDEALLSFYFGESASFVWALAKDKPLSFRALPITTAELDAKVAKLREALEPEIATVKEIPAFDVPLAYSLYQTLLAPVEDVWGPAKNLLVVTNGSLGFLPLGLLPTTPTQPTADPAVLFAEYRDVPWLARQHAITAIPSVSTLKALRTTELVDAQRQKLIGFGDPYFNKREAEEAAKEAAATPVVADPEPDPGDPYLGEDPLGPPIGMQRGLPQGDFSEALAELPRLPDTAEELRAIASALDVNPATALRLGKEANEQVVKSTKLSLYRIVAFATHGLMADDIDGLDQPALALTAPKVAGIEGSGLLTSEDILGLKLNADWVVLSACNTAAASGAGAEAASGLGRAFFYAGARALIVTNWSVQSSSARELITDIFRRQGADPKLSRAEALREAMMGLIDGPGMVDAAGATQFSYAHPLFWAPYTIIGDGGGP
jgi:CHAT domain-containing protein